MELTKKYNRLFWAFFMLSLLLNVGPIAYYVGEAALGGALVHQKVALSLLVVVVLIMSAVSWMNKVAMRSKIWVIVIGLYFCLDHFIAPIMVIAATQIADECFATPLYKSYKTKRNTHREIDKRLP